MIDLDELERLAKAATPGPWSWIKDNFRGGYSGLYADCTPVIYPQRENDGDDGAAWFGTDEDYYGETALSESDAAFIAAFNPSVAQELINRLREAEKALTAVSDLINHSEGVVGLHLNGDIASWDELRTGGRFEGWLIDFDAAMAKEKGNEYSANRGRV